MTHSNLLSYECTLEYFNELSFCSNPTAAIHYMLFMEDSNTDCNLKENMLLTTHNNVGIDLVVIDHLADTAYYYVSGTEKH
eukprot:scaffold73183_cov65-Cyclotella_meneghiniana.AAC.1